MSATQEHRRHDRPIGFRGAILPVRGVPEPAEDTGLGLEPCEAAADPYLSLPTPGSRFPGSRA